MEQTGSLASRAASASTRAQRIEAYGRLVERFRDMACGYAFSILGDFHLAEDAAQEAFVTAFEKLRELAEPDAFPGWFRRIVWSACGRITRRRTPPAVPLAAAARVPSEMPEPHERLERKELRERVLEAIRQLPADQREVTALFYINGYSQRDISEFLEVPVSTIKNRLSASRSRLKERMWNMVEDTLRGNAPDERFDRKVIDELLARPRLMELEGHPVREVFDAIRAALPDFEVVEGEEVILNSGIVNPWCRQFAYQLDDDKALRTETTSTTFDAARGRSAPVRLLTAGRTFLSRKEDAEHMRVGHQADGLAIEAGADATAMRATLEKVLEAVFGPAQVRYKDTVFHWFSPCHVVGVRLGSQWQTVCGCGVMTPKTLHELGQDPGDVGGYAFTLRLDRAASLQRGLDDIRKLWQPPYLP